MMNTAALLLETEVNEREVLFCSYDNDVSIYMQKYSQKFWWGIIYIYILADW